MGTGAMSPRKAACDHVYAAFPDMKGSRPTMKQNGQVRVFTFAKTLSDGSGPALKQIVRVSVDQSGKVLKVVASR
jgi:hypothetical protein